MARAKIFHPFDVTYDEVNRNIRAFAGGLQGVDHRWLEAIAKDFQIEADSWDQKRYLESYRVEMSRLRLRILRLAAGAYLHICYDLPRVLANNWPGDVKWPAISPQRGEIIYNRIGGLFSDAMASVSTMSEVSGVFKPVFSWPKARQMAEVWLRLLRSDAWRHAQRLANESSSQRTVLELQILQAITTVLKDVSSRYPLHIIRMVPPVMLEDSVVMYSLSMLPIVLLTDSLTENDRLFLLSWTSLVLSALACGFVAGEALTRRRRKAKNQVVIDDKTLKKLDKADLLIAQIIEKTCIKIQNALVIIFEMKSKESDMPQS